MRMILPMNRPVNRTYKLRGSRITKAQEQAFERNWHNFQIELVKPLILNSYFPNYSRTILEIGSGMGEATSEIAASFPDTGFVAVEMHKPGLGALLMEIEKRELNNLKMIQEDAQVVLKEFIPEDSIDAIHLFFPDPWPKLRHRKRRIIQPEFVELMASRLKPNGYVQIATDWKEYADWMERIFKLNPRFSGGVIQRPDWRPISKFEGKGLRKGHLVTDLKFVKVS